MKKLLSLIILFGFLNSKADYFKFGQIEIDRNIPLDSIEKITGFKQSEKLIDLSQYNENQLKGMKLVYSNGKLKIAKNPKNNGPILINKELPIDGLSEFAFVYQNDATFIIHLKKGDQADLPIYLPVQDVDFMGKVMQWNLQRGYGVSINFSDLEQVINACENKEVGEECGYASSDFYFKQGVCDKNEELDLKYCKI